MSKNRFKNILNPKLKELGLYINMTHSIQLIFITILMELLIYSSSLKL